jgi:hypothetical protein
MMLKPRAVEVAGAGLMNNILNVNDELLFIEM